MIHTLDTETDIALMMWETASDAAWLALENGDDDSEAFWDSRCRIWRKIYFTLSEL